MNDLDIPGSARDVHGRNRPRSRGNGPKELARREFERRSCSGIAKSMRGKCVRMWGNDLHQHHHAIAFTIRSSSTCERAIISAANRDEPDDPRREAPPLFSRLRRLLWRSAPTIVEEGDYKSTTEVVEKTLASVSWLMAADEGVAAVDEGDGSSAGGGDEGVLGGGWRAGERRGHG
ncbi:cysteine/Histidine-rich C1 domain family protein [Striga asiatica]|uniref:Cysteine/Histidine-rich C1 domain family protein n=1 Tax=Striga asiatica TaxID=4170 RepID=A0A5A7PUX2_STRAF|nr:cysteine/Histidine-rich C1 domain family protein [Striga asiatica]